MKKPSLIPLAGSFAAVFAFAGQLHAEDAWWNTAWTQRQKITLDSDAAAVAEATGSTSVLVRLFDGNFQFTGAREDGSDLRFVAADGKTLLPHQIERFDNLINEAFVWVKLPEVKPATKQTFHVYFCNADAAMPAAAKPADAFDSDTALVYHFSERATAPADATANGNNAATGGATAEGAIIGSGLRLLGASPITIPASASLAWKQDQPLTISTWVKPIALQENATLISRVDEKNSWRLLIDQGIPAVEVVNAGRTVRTPVGAPVAAGTWTHLALIADGKTLRLFLNGTLYASIDGTLPVLNSPLSLGGLAAEVAGNNNYTGEIDELSISRSARSVGWVKLASVNQGSSDAAQRTLSLGALEGDGVKEQSHLMQHLSLFGDIAKNMMFDGWIAIGVCAIMIVIGWTVAIRKFIYLNSIEKGTQLFLKQWKSLSTDLTALDPEDHSNVSSLGGKVETSELELIEKSPLFHIYQIGSEEIRHRLDKDNNRVEGLSGRSIQAIRASLDAGLVRESHRLSDGLVYLTISIAGGPYVGLLGTVVGVMITFAIIAKSGEVNVNSIAPGIASALLATVVGLVVAIPALFIYSYLNGRIKNSLALMQVFIDEFVAKMAEFYRPAQESDQTKGSTH
jgi:biopolymer transport protein ExbB